MAHQTSPGSPTDVNHEEISELLIYDGRSLLQPDSDRLLSQNVTRATAEQNMSRITYTPMSGASRSFTNSEHFLQPLSSDSFNDFDTSVFQEQQNSDSTNPHLSSFQTTQQNRRPSQASGSYTETQMQGETQNPTGRASKRPRYEPDTANEHTWDFDEQTSPSASMVPPIQGPKHTTVLLCALWALKNPGKEPSEQTIDELSCLCGDPAPAVRSVFETDKQRYHDQQTPPVITAAACELLKFMNVGKHPKEWQETMLGGLFNEPRKSISVWFTRHSSPPQEFEDSGNCTMTRTRTSLDTEIALRTRYNRKICRRKSGQQPLLRKDPQRKYVCTSLCGKTFNSKAAWKKHEQNNRVQELWLCNFIPCQQSSEETEGWSRQDELSSHVKKHHEGRENEIQKHGIKIPTNVRGNCLWRNCDVTFQSFHEFIQHTEWHFNQEWEAADLRDAEEEIDAPLEPLPTDDHSRGPAIMNPSEGDDGSPPPDAGAGSSPRHRSSTNQQSGSGSSRSRQPSTGNSNLHGTRYSSNYGSHLVMHLATASSFKSLYRSASALLMAKHDLSPKHVWQKMNLSSSEIYFLGRLGSGGTSVVDEVRISGMSGTMACKTFSAEWRPEIFRELETMSKLEHPHIVKLVYGCLDAGSTAILMQPVADYNLSQYLTTCASAGNEQGNIWVWFSCLTCGLVHMHKNGVRHQDIKPSNILVKDKKVFFADFGSSTIIENDQHSNYHTLGFTDLYAAPEVFKGERRMASDVFSLGCVFLEMATILLSRGLWQELRLLQRRSYNHKAAKVHWAYQWSQTLLNFATSKVEETSLQVLLYVCRTMTDPSPEQRPSAADIEAKLKSQLDTPCSYSSTFNCGKKAYTWPMDQTAAKAFQPPSNDERSVSQARKSSKAEVYEITHTSQELEIRTVTDLSTPKSNAKSRKRSRTTTIEKFVLDSNGGKLDNMMSTFLGNRDQYEEFRISGQTSIMNIVAADMPSSSEPFPADGTLLGPGQWSILSSRSISTIRRLYNSI